MAFPQEHTNYPKVIIEAIIDDIGNYVADVNIQNVVRFPELDTDPHSFVQQYGRAVQLRLAEDLEVHQASDTWETTYTFECRCYVSNSDDTIYALTDLVEDVKHALYVNQSGQSNWYNMKPLSVTYPEPEAEQLIQIADMTFIVSMRAV